MGSWIWVKGSVWATRSGMMNRQGVVILAKASIIFGKGLFSLISKTRSLTSRMSASWDSRRWPKASRRAQRRMEATQSRPRTGSLSWKRRFSRRVKVQVRPSGCRCGPAPSAAAA
jgi:hypothetical protein